MGLHSLFPNPDRNPDPTPGALLGSAFSFADSPAAFIAHTFAFIFSGVAIYVRLTNP